MQEPDLLLRGEREPEHRRHRRARASRSTGGSAARRPSSTATPPITRSSSRATSIWVRTIAPRCGSIAATTSRPTREVRSRCCPRVRCSADRSGPWWAGSPARWPIAAFNEVRASFLSNKPPIICNQAGDRRLGAARAWTSGDVRAAQLSGRDVRVRLHRARSRGRFVLQRHLLVPARPASDEGRRGTAAQVRTIIDSLNVRNGAWTFPTDLAFDINNPEQLSGSLVGRTLDSQLRQAGLGLWRLRAGLMERSRRPDAQPRDPLRRGPREHDRQRVHRREEPGAGAAGRRSAGLRAAQLAAQRVAACWRRSGARASGCRSAARPACSTT